MQRWSITFHGPAGILSTVDTGESQFVIGTETASDVFTVQGEAIASRHAWVWISEAGLQVEDLGGGTLVNGYQITERVQVEYPASVQVGDVTLVIEVKAVQPVAVSPTPSSLDITIPQRAVTKTKASMEVTIPQRTPTRGNVQKSASASDPLPKSTSANKASPTCEYTLVKEIARGGMGQIYFGEDPQLKRNVAVKVSSVSEGGEDPRFSKEAEVLAQLAHPNIVPIHNIGVDAQGRPFYSMKLVKGRTLQAVLNLIRDGDANANKEYPRATLLTIFRKVCDAMMFAHSKGILHRDLKPENIMVGEYGEVLVMDWGLAKVLGETDEQGFGSSRVNDTGDYGMTMEGEVMGTPQYMSPEQAMGMVAELDARSDIYSLGGILYAILMLRPPIEGTTLDEVLTKVKNGSISSMVTKRGGKGGVTVGAPTAMGAEVPEALQAVTLKAMATDRNKRYAKVDAFAGDIERYQNGFATSAEQAGALRQLMLFTKRNKGVSATVAAFLLAAIGFTVRLGIEKQQARASEQRAIANEQKASAEMENARREAAKAMVALAEAAEESGDSEGMRSALAKVPADLRDSIWGYLDERSDSADLKVAPPDGVDWLHVDKCPDDPNSVVAVQTNGQVCVVNTNTGQIQQLWKAERKGASLFGFSVSEEGKRIALLWVKGGSPTAEIEVCGLRNGERQGPETIATQIVKALDKGGHGVVIASRFLFVWSKTANSSADLEAWDLNSGQKLWKRNSVQTFCWDAISESLCVLRGKAEGIAAADGATLFSGEAIHRFSWNFPRTAEIDCEKNLLFFASPEARSMRVYNLRSGSLGWETHYRFGSPLSLTRDPNGQYVGVLYWRSILGSVFEIRDAANGALIEAHPFVNKRASGGRTNLRIACSGTAFVIGFPKRILGWRFGKASPVEWTKPYTSRLNFGSMLPMKEGTRVARISQKPGGAQTELWISPFGDLDHEKNAPINFPGDGWYGATDAFGVRLTAFQPSSNMVAGYRVRGDGLEEVWAPRKMGGAYFALPAPTADRLWAAANVVEFSTGNIVAPLKLDSLEFVRLGVRMEKSITWVGDEHLAGAVLRTGANVDQAQERLLAIWSAQTGELLAQSPANQIRSIAASPDARWVVEGGEDKRVRIRNGRTLAVEYEFRAHERAVTGVAWHPQLPLLVTRDEGCVRIWNTQTWRKEEEFTLELGDGALHIQGNGTRLSVSDDGRVELYEPASFRR